LLSGLEHAAPGDGQDDCADVYLSKPVRPEELTSCLETLLSSPLGQRKIA
jgi:DNA-binding response OmpR family regulator